MDNNGHKFRKKLFGGFDRADVSRYILSLAEERNDQAARADALEKTVGELKEETELLRSRLDDALQALEKAGPDPASDDPKLPSAARVRLTRLGESLAPAARKLTAVVRSAPRKLPRLIAAPKTVTERREFTVSTDELRSRIPEMHAGDRVLLSGTVYTARDAAHKEIFRLLDAGEPLPFDLKDAVIYYAGPTPGTEGHAVGSCGPTTSSRMDRFAPRLYSLGLAATVGKGERSDEVEAAIVKNRAVYLCATGGAGALIAKHIVSAEEIAFPELGCESVKRFTVEGLPLTVGVDSHGNSIFRSALGEYAVRR